MGVLACSRTSCPKIMCDETININDSRFDICRRCREEFEQAVEQWKGTTDPLDWTPRLLAKRAREFMDSEPGTYTPKPTEPMDVDAAVRDMFKSAHD